MLAPPGDLARVQRRQHGDCAEEPAGEVAHGDARADRRPAGLAGDRHAAAIALGHHVEGGAVAVGPLFAEAGHTARDDAGVERGERRVVDAEPLRNARTEVVDDDVGLGRERVEESTALVPLQVDAGALFVAIEGAEVWPHALVAVAGVVGEQAAGHLAAARRLHLDRLGAEIRQQHRREGTRQHMRQVEHHDVREGLHQECRACCAGGKGAHSMARARGRSMRVAFGPHASPRDTIARRRQVSGRRAWRQKRSAGA